MAMDRSHGAARFRRIASLMAMLVSMVALAASGPQQEGPVGASASRQADDVLVIVIDGPIDAVTAQSVRRRIAMAEQSGADAIVFELDTPGGAIGAVLEICEAIKTSSIPNTVAWVHHEAISGGAFIAVACRDMVTADPAKLGNALPVLTALGIFHVPMSESDRQKMISQLLVELVDSARRHGYDEKLVQGFITLGVELWLVEKIDDPSQRLFIDREEYKLLFGTEPDAASPEIPSFEIGERGTDVAEAPEGDDFEPQATQKAGEDDPTRFQPASPQLQRFVDEATGALQQPSQRPRLTRDDLGKWRVVSYVSDGKSPVVLTHDLLLKYGLAETTVQNDAQLKDFFAAQRIERARESWSESLVRIMTMPWVRGVLIVVFLLGLFLEMASPGLSIPGAVALAALVGLLAPPAMIGMAQWWEIGAIGLGIGLILLEVFVTPGFGVFGVGGLVLLFAGLVGTFVGGPTGAFEQPGHATSQALRGLVIIVLALGTSGVAMYFLSKRIGSLPLLSALVLKDAEPDEIRDELLEAMAQPTTPAVRVGAEGVATAALHPIGRVEIDGEILDARADLGYIEAGQRIRVVALADLGRVIVAPIEDEAGGRRA
ncbi:MAG: NfeD family protein [Phycisphaerales bacterium JB039]